MDINDNSAYFQKLEPCQIPNITTPVHVNKLQIIW
jgi:hypothetical protein